MYVFFICSFFWEVQLIQGFSSDQQQDQNNNNPTHKRKFFSKKPISSLLGFSNRGPQEIGVLRSSSTQKHQSKPRNTIPSEKIRIHHLTPFIPQKAPLADVWVKILECLVMIIIYFHHWFSSIKSLNSFFPHPYACLIGVDSLPPSQPSFSLNKFIIDHWPCGRCQQKHRKHMFW